MQFRTLSVFLLSLVASTAALDARQDGGSSIDPADASTALASLTSALADPSVTSDLASLTSDLPALSSDLASLTSDLPAITSDLASLTTNLPALSSALSSILSDLPSGAIPSLTSLLGASGTGAVVSAAESILGIGNSAATSATGAAAATSAGSSGAGRIGVGSGVGMGMGVVVGGIVMGAAHVLL